MWRFCMPMERLVSYPAILGAFEVALCSSVALPEPYYCLISDLRFRNSNWVYNKVTQSFRLSLNTGVSIHRVSWIYGFIRCYWCQSWGSNKSTPMESSLKFSALDLSFSTSSCNLLVSFSCVGGQVPVSVHRFRLLSGNMSRPLYFCLEPRILQLSYYNSLP